MTEIRVLLAFGALCLFTLWFISRGVLASLAPLCAVCSTALWFSLWGCFGHMWLGGVIYYGFILALIPYFIITHFVRRRPFYFFGFGFWFFVLGGLLVIALLWAGQPKFATWDEFSFWGTSQKLAKLYGQLYTTAPVGWAWHATQTPALIGFGYFFQFFGQGFLEWQVYAACDIFMLSAMAALVAPFEKKDWNVAVPTMLMAVIAPFVFTLYRSVTSPSAIYADSLSDIPMGFMFAAALAAYYAEDHALLSDMVPPCLALAVLTLTKDIGFSFALVAVVIMAADYLFAYTPAPQLATENTVSVQEAVPKRITPKRVRGGLARLGLGLAATLAAFGGWAFYLKLAFGINRTESLGGVQELGMLQMPGVFFAELFSGSQSEVFTYVTTQIPQNFLHVRINMVGTGLINVMLIAAMLALAAFMAKKHAHRLRCIWFGVLSALGFFAYNLLIAMTYIYLFRPEQALVLEGHERYMYSYYIPWFLVSFMLLAMSAKGLSGWRAAAARLAPAALCGLLFLRVWLMVPVQYTVFGINSAEYALQRQESADIQALRNPLPPESRIFLVNTDPYGLGWFKYCYEFLPWQLDYSYGGGELLIREKQEDGTILKTPVSLNEFKNHLKTNKCDIVLVVDADEDFVRKYSPAFEDGMQGYLSEKTQYYMVAEEENDIVLKPVYNFEVLYAENA